MEAGQFTSHAGKAPEPEGGVPGGSGLPCRLDQRSQVKSCIAWNAPAIGIRWPYNGQPQVSAKDALGVGLGGAELSGL
jgi:hypothetical protein